MGFQLFAPRWFGWQMLPGYGDGRYLPWFSPIHLRRVTPLKTGRGLLDIEFLQPLYAEGVQNLSVRLKVLYHGDNFLAGQIVQPDRSPTMDNRLAIISHIEFGWLAQFCPQLLEAFPLESLDALQANSVSMYLNGLFFQNPPLPPQPENLDDGSENAWLLTCALRFDGYAYGLDHGVEREIYEVGLGVLRGEEVPRALSVGERMTLMFLLQRGLMKEGVRSKTDAGWKVFRELFLELAAEPIPTAYQMQHWHREWTRLFAPILPVGEKLIQHLHETCQYDGQH